MAEIFQSAVQFRNPAVFRGKLAEKLPGSDELSDALGYADVKGHLFLVPEF